MRDRFSMRVRLRSLMVVLVLALGAGVAHGKECEGVVFADQVETDGGRLQLNGLGLRQATLFKVDVYVAGLYLSQISSDAASILELDMPTQIVLHFVRDVERKALIEGWDAGFGSNAGDATAALTARIETFKGMMADVQTGDRLDFLYIPGVGTRVSVKGTSQGTIQGADFAQALYGIWLGPRPPNTDLKSGLLGGTCE